MRATTDNEEQRRRELRRHKARATGLLLLATIAFLVLVATTDGDGWSGYAIAVAEAAMVGGVADWFAVAALFRHPLGLPIPHTAIIPKRKDQIGASLGEFVQDNFLQPEVVRDRLAAANLAGRIGDWLAVPGNARRVGDQAGTVIGSAVELLRDHEIQSSIEGYVQRRVDTFEPTPLAAPAIEFAIQGGHHHAILDAGLEQPDHPLRTAGRVAGVVDRVPVDAALVGGPPRQGHTVRLEAHPGHTHASHARRHPHPERADAHGVIDEAEGEQERLGLGHAAWCARRPGRRRSGRSARAG